MSDVKRFDFDVSGCQVEDPLGGYVDHDDYAKLEAEAQALREEVEAANDRADTLEHRMMGMMTRHFAEAWRTRDTEKALDGYLSAGIAELERERDAALEELSACTEHPGGCGYWREAAKRRAQERDAALARAVDLEAALLARSVEYAYARDAAAKGDAARAQCGGMEMEIQELRNEVTAYEDGMRSLACQLGAGGFNAESLTAAQLVAKVQWGINNLTETQGSLLDEVRSERDELRARVVVMAPERKAVPEYASQPMMHCGATGWNACLDELARLNGKAVSEGLLRRTLEFIKATNYQGSTPLGLIAELSDLLGEGKEVGHEADA